MSIARRLIKIEGDVEPFIFKVQTTSANTVLQLPLTNPDFRQPSILVDWGDGDTSTVTSITSQCNSYICFTGTYTVEIQGSLLDLV